MNALKAIRKTPTKTLSVWMKTIHEGRLDIAEAILPSTKFTHVKQNLVFIAAENRQAKIVSLLLDLYLVKKLKRLDPAFGKAVCPLYLVQFIINSSSLVK